MAETLDDVSHKKQRLTSPGSAAVRNVPRLNLSNVPPQIDFAVEAEAGLPLPPPPPSISSSSNLGERRRSSVGLRASLPPFADVSSASVAAGSDGGGPTLPTTSATTSDARWELLRDEKEQPYYLHSESGESRWAYAADNLWMEVEDSTSGCIYLEHSVSGEMKWRTGEPTVWEEMKDPDTQAHYWYSKVAEEAQWEEPEWVDYICTSTGCIYYLNTRTQESTWIKPSSFTAQVSSSGTCPPATAAPASSAAALGRDSMVHNTPSQSSSGVAASLETPRNLPLATPRMINQPPIPNMDPSGHHQSFVVGPGKKKWDDCLSSSSSSPVVAVAVAPPPSSGAASTATGGAAAVRGLVQYSINKRPKTACPPRLLQTVGAAASGSNNGGGGTDGGGDPEEASG